VKSSTIPLLEADHDHLDEYLQWDDWKVLGALSNTQGGEHGRRLRERDHLRPVYETPETPSEDDRERFRKVKKELGSIVKYEKSLGKAWYKFASEDIPIASENPEGTVRPLSEHSAAVKGLLKTDRMLLYCTKEKKEAAKKIIDSMEN
jgi:uncharacterized protein